MKAETVKEFRVGNKLVKIFQDNFGADCRSWDNLTKMVCFHKRYSLGDKHDYKHDDYDSWAEMKEAISKKEDVAIIKPLYMYDHSGITIKTTPYGDRWDSGQIGWVFITKKTLRENFSAKKITKKLLERADAILEGDVETYRQEVEGDVYRFEEYEVKTCDMGCEHEEMKDSCGSFYGTDWATNGITDHVSKEIAEVIKAEAEAKKARLVNSFSTAA